MSLPAPSLLNDYIRETFLAVDTCVDCKAAESGYRETRLCVGCYRDRYAEEPGNHNEGDSVRG